VFPGVGHAKEAMKEIQNYGLHEIIPQLKQPVLGICLGMQLMCAFSEEGNTRGLGIFEELEVTKFPEKVKSPHIGWNQLEKTEGFLGEISGNVYFVHSYFAAICNYTVAQSNNGINFSAALHKNNFFACQFHPEKSGLIGEQILNNFLSSTK
jgi:glutamine amidotransferase